MNHEALAALESEPVMARSIPESPVSVRQVREAGWTLDDLWLPAVTLDRDALEHNLRRFAGWAADHGAGTAPHGKTTMAPQLWREQLDHGSWAITVANVGQARVARRYGFDRLIIANQVVEHAQIVWLAEQLGDPGFEVYVLVDSLDGIALLERGLQAADRPLDVLVELGAPGGRTGARSMEDGLVLARAVAASPALRLAGVEGYEGVFPGNRDDDSPDRARAWLDVLAEAAHRFDAEDLFAEVDRVLLTAGGSSFPDLVLDALTPGPTLSRPVFTVIRSGGYLTHDDLMMQRSSPLRAGVVDDPLVPALTGWARVVSTPEQGLALLSMGKRDVSYDIDLPVPRALWRDGTRIELDGSATVTKLNDQHAFVDDRGTGERQIRVNDVLELGLSHPCTVFDKWSLIPVLDAERRVVDAIRTVF